MNQLKLVADTEERLGTAQKEITVRQKAPVEVLSDSAFRSQVEIYEHVTAEDGIEVAHSDEVPRVGEVYAAEADAVPNGLLDLQLIAGLNEILLFVVARYIPGTVSVVCRGAGVIEGAVIQVCSEDFEGTAAKKFGGLFLQNDAERIRFFTRGTSGAPDAHRTRGKRSLGVGDFA